MDIFVGQPTYKKKVGPLRYYLKWAGSGCLFERDLIQERTRATLHYSPRMKFK
jgi:hypothetical protein